MCIEERKNENWNFGGHSTGNTRIAGLYRNYLQI